MAARAAAKGRIRRSGRTRLSSVLPGERGRAAALPPAQLSQEREAAVLWAQTPPAGAAHVAGGLEAAGGVLGHGLEDDALDGSAGSGRRVQGRRQRGGDVLQDDGVGVSASKGTWPCTAGREERQGIDVGAGIARLALALFRRHVGRRARCAAGLGDWRWRPACGRCQSR